MSNKTDKVPFINSQYVSLLPSSSIEIIPTRSTSASWHPLWNNNDSIWKIENSRPRSNSLVLSSNTSILDDYFLPRKRGSFVQSDLGLSTKKDNRSPTPPFQEPMVINPSLVSANVHDLGKGLLIEQIKSNEIYQVEFKMNRLDYFYTIENQFIEIHDHVIVEGDRGYDLGKVTAVVDKKTILEKNIRQLFCKASKNEINNHRTKQEEEEKALAICQWKIKQKDLQMKVVDAEYQWDRRKLTFYFLANQRIDFRDLVRELFKIYKTRIWMSGA